MRQGLKVSLIIPVYNESGKIRACMDNIAGVDGLHEVIFADGGSTDGTPDIIGGRYGLQHAELKPAGAAVAYRLRGSGNIYG